MKRNKLGKMHKKELFLRKYLQIYRPLLQKEKKEEKQKTSIAKMYLNIDAAA